MSAREEQGGAFAVGDRVTVIAHNGNLVGVRSVVALAPSGKTFTDSRGAQWCNADMGRAKGTLSERYYTGNVVRATRPGDADIVRRSVLIGRMRDMPWAGLSLETLTAIDTLIQAETTKKAGVDP